MVGKPLKGFRTFGAGPFILTMASDVSTSCYIAQNIHPQKKNNNNIRPNKLFYDTLV